MSSYSFLDTLCTLTGPGISINLGAGAGVAEEGISFEFEGDKDTMTIGADGAVMHSLNASQAGTCTVRLLKTSPQNRALQAAYNAQRLTASTWGQNNISLNQPALGDKINAQGVAFKKGTGVTYAKDGNLNEWAFNVGRLDMFLGSSAV